MFHMDKNSGVVYLFERNKKTPRMEYTILISFIYLLKLTISMWETRW